MILKHILLCISTSDWTIRVVVIYTIILWIISVFKKIECKRFDQILSRLTVR